VVLPVKNGRLKNADSKRSVNPLTGVGHSYSASYDKEIKAALAGHQKGADLSDLKNAVTPLLNGTTFKPIY